MKINVRHAYDCSPTQWWAMYWDDSFDEILRATSDVQRDVLEEKTEGDVVVRRLRFTPARELPRAVASILGSTRLTYEQENRWDRPASALHWRVIPSFLPGKFDAAGKFEIRPTATGCEQVISGEVKVNVPLLGGQIEKTICGEIEGSYEKTAVAARRWLRDREE